MNEVNKTLYIPLYGKAFVSQRGIILNDQSAEIIWAKEGFELKGKSKSKWLAYYMGPLWQSFSFDGLLYHRRGENVENKKSINDVGVREVYGLDDPTVLTMTGMEYLRELDMTPPQLINQLSGAERAIFKTIYGGGASKKLYRLYEFQK